MRHDRENIKSDHFSKLFQYLYTQFLKNDNVQTRSPASITFYFWDTYWFTLFSYCLLCCGSKNVFCSWRFVIWVTVVLLYFCRLAIHRSYQGRLQTSRGDWSWKKSSDKMVSGKFCVSFIKLAGISYNLRRGQRRFILHCGQGEVQVYAWYVS